MDEAAAGRKSMWTNLDFSGSSLEKEGKGVGQADNQGQAADEKNL